MYIPVYIYVYMSMRNFVYSKDLKRSCGQYSVTNRLFPARPNYQSVGGVITSGVYWGKKGDVMLRVYT